MFGIDDAILWPAAASIFGGMLGNKSREDTAEKQMAFQASHSNTAHQREVEDLIAAGLNPMLSVKLGGASSPAGAQAQIQDVIGPSIASAQQGRLVAAQVDQVKAQTALALAQARNQDADIWVKNATIDHLNSQTDVGRAQVGSLDANTARVPGQMALDRATVSSILEAMKKMPLERDQIRGQINLQDFQQRVLSSEVLRNLSQADVNRIEAQLKRLDIPGAEASAKFFEGAVGEQSPAIRLILQIIGAMSKLK